VNIEPIIRNVSVILVYKTWFYNFETMSIYPYERWAITSSIANMSQYINAFKKWIKCIVYWISIHLVTPRGRIWSTYLSLLIPSLAYFWILDDKLIQSSLKVFQRLCKVKITNYCYNDWQIDSTIFVCVVIFIYFFCKENNHRNLPSYL